MTLVKLTYIMDEKVFPVTVHRWKINETPVDERTYRDAELTLADIARFVTGENNLEDGSVVYPTTYDIPDPANYNSFISKFCPA